MKPAFARSWRVGRRTATLTVPRQIAAGAVHVHIEWSPSLPGRLNPDEQEAYFTGWDAALADLARELGLDGAKSET